MSLTLQQQERRVSRLYTGQRHYHFGIWDVDGHQYYIAEHKVPGPGAQFRFRLQKVFDLVDMGAEGMNYSSDGDPWTVVPREPNTMAYLNEVPRGVQDYERTGKSIQLDGISLRLDCRTSTSGVIWLSKCTTLLVYARVPAPAPGADPTWTTLLTSQSPDAFENRDYDATYKILRRWDWFIVASNDPTVPGGGQNVIEEYVPLNGLRTTWQELETTGDGRLMKKGQLILATVGDHSYVSNRYAVLGGSTRLYFSDC